jgi:folate-binding protein YgfZ
MDARDLADRVRRSAGVFALEDRGVLAVRGGDRVRWLNGMITNDVTKLAPGPAASGCYALLLTRQGRIVADLHVLLREDELWLETARVAVPVVRERLMKLVIADDVELVDRSDELARFGVEGPQAPELVSAALDRPDAIAGLARDAGVDARIGDEPVVVAAFGFGGGSALQVLAPRAARDAVAAALARAAATEGAAAADAATLELLRIEAGVPRLGAELTEEVLPPEAHLENAISYTKGCYTGQEIVARLRSRGQVAHLLVGLTAEGGAALEVGAAIEAEGETIGEVRSAALSRRFGSIGLGFVKRALAEPGTPVRIAGRPARTCGLPFGGAGSPA